MCVCDNKVSVFISVAPQDVISHLSETCLHRLKHLNANQTVDSVVLSAVPIVVA